MVGVNMPTERSQRFWEIELRIISKYSDFNIQRLTCWVLLLRKL